MKDFELKFYREWYDALSELSHDDRAEAALALLEYVYDGKIPDDQFIRIVTTLMRNRIDRDKAAHTRRQSSKSSQPTPPDNDNIPNPSFDPDVRASAQSQQPSGNNENSQLIEEIIQKHYNPDNEMLGNFCKRHKCDVKEIAIQAKKIMTQWVAVGSWHPTKLPDRSKESILWKLDKLALANLMPQPSSTVESTVAKSAPKS